MIIHNHWQVRTGTSQSQLCTFHIDTFLRKVLYKYAPLYTTFRNYPEGLEYSSKPEMNGSFPYSIIELQLDTAITISLIMNSLIILQIPEKEINFASC